MDHIKINRCVRIFFESRFDIKAISSSKRNRDFLGKENGRVIGWIVACNGHLFCMVGCGHMAGDKKFVYQFLVFQNRFEVSDEFNLEGPIVDFDERKIAML